MKLKFKTVLAGGAVLLLAGAAAAFLLSGKALINLSLPDPFGRRDESVSAVLLEEIKALYRLNTVKYLGKLVFPYDFMDPSVSPRAVEATLKGSPASPAALLAPAELEYFEALGLARELGMAVGPRRFDFVVVGCSVKAGFDLTGAARAAGAPTGVKVESAGGRRVVTLELPPVVLDEVAIEDPGPANYPYPDLKLSPEKWRAVAVFVEAKLRRRVLAEGILAKAEAAGREFLRRLLLESGFDEVRFVAAKDAN